MSLVFHPACRVCNWYFKYIGDPSHVLDFTTVKLDDDLTYDADKVAILECHVRKL